MQRFIIFIRIFIILGLMGATQGDVGAIWAAPALQIGCPNPNPPTIRIDDVTPRLAAQSYETALTIYGYGFTASSKVDMVGVGLIATEFITSTLLRATVPSSRAPADYNLVVRNTATGECSNLFSKITVTQPIVVPTATSANPTPVPGQPVLTLQNYTISPSKVKPGEEFEVSVLFYNTGSRGAENTLISFAGGAFVPVGASNGYLMGLVNINASTGVRQRLRAPDNIQGGIQEVKINLGANDFEGKHYTFNASVPVEVETPRPTPTPLPTPAGKPQLVISRVKIDSPKKELGPDDTFTVTLQLTNRGNKAATNILVKFGSPDVVAPADDSNITSLNVIGAGENAEMYQPLTINRAVTAGRKGIDVTLDYVDAAGQVYNLTQQIGIDVLASTLARPQMVLGNVGASPQPLYIGQPFTLNLSLQNVGGSAANRMSVALGGDTGASLKPFSPIGASNVQFVPNLEVGKNANLSQSLFIDGNATPGSYNLEVALNYEDPKGTKYKESQFISLQVRRRPVFRISTTRAITSAVVGQAVPVSLEMLNLSSQSVNVSTVDVASEQMQVRLPSRYLGPINGGGINTFDTVVVPQAPGPQILEVRLNYLDEFNQPQAIIEKIPIEVSRTIVVSQTQNAPNPANPNNRPQTTQPQNQTQPDSFIIRLLKGLLGLGS